MVSLPLFTFNKPGSSTAEILSNSPPPSNKQDTSALEVLQQNVLEFQPEIFETLRSESVKALPALNFAGYRSNYCEKLLKEETPLEPNEKQFSLMNGSPYLKNTGKEGGNAGDQLNYWEKVIRQEIGAHSQLRLSQEEREGLLTEIEFAKKAAAAIDAKDSKKFYELIQDALKIRGKCTFPIKYISLKGIPGHVWGLTLTKDSLGNVCAHHLNKGEHSQKHPVIVLTPNKEMYSYRSLPIRLKCQNAFAADKLAGEAPFEMALLNHLINYSTNSPQDNEPTFSPSNQYELFEKFGFVENFPSHSFEDLASSEQRCGNCPEIFMRLLFRDHLGSASGLIDNMQQRKKAKHLIFCGRFESFRMALKSLSDERFDAIQPKNIRLAAEEFALSLDGWWRSGVITAEELARGYILTDLVWQKADEKIRSKKTTALLPSLNDQHASRFDMGQALQPVNVDRSFVFFEETSHTILANTPPPEKLARTLKDWQSQIQAIQQRGAEFDRLEAVHMLSAMVSLLPLPKKDPSQETYWNRIPSADRAECLKWLTELAYTPKFLDPVSNSSVLQNRGELFPELLMINSSCLCIAWHLSQEIEELKLKGRSIAFQPAIDNKFLSEFTFRNGKEAARFDEIVKYFQDMPNKPIFGHLDAKEDFKTVVENLISPSPPDTPMTHHLAYLYQFLDETPDAWPVPHRLLMLCTRQSAGWFVELKKRFSMHSYMPVSYYNLEKLIVLAKLSLENAEGVNYSYRGLDSDVKSENRQVVYTLDNLDAIKAQQIKCERENWIEMHPLAKQMVANSSNENAIMTEDVPEEVSNLLYHELLIMLSQENVRIPALISLCRRHQHLVNEAPAKELIEYALLHSTVLIKALVNEPSLIKELHQLLEDIAAPLLNPSTYLQGLSWLRLAGEVESYFQEACRHLEHSMGIKQSNERLQQLAQKAMQLGNAARLHDQQLTENSQGKSCSSYEGALSALHILLQSACKDENIYKEITHAWLKVHAEKSDYSCLPKWLKPAVDHQMISVHKEISSLLAEHASLATAWTKDFCKEWGLILEGTIAWQPQKEYPLGFTLEDNGNHYLLDLYTGELRRNQILLEHSAWPAALRHDWIKEGLGLTYKDQWPSVVVIDEKTLAATDNSFCIKTRGNYNHQLEKVFQIGGKKQTFQFVQKDWQFPSVLKQLCEKRQLWIGVDQTTHGYQLLVTEKNGKPYAAGEFNSSDQSCQIHRLDLLGMPTSDVWLANPGAHNSLVNFLNGIWSWMHCTGWIDQTTGQFSRYEIEDFNHFVLTCCVDGKTGLSHLETPSLPGYRLADERTLAQLHHIEGILVFEKKEPPHSKVVLIPNIHRREAALIGQSTGTTRSELINQKTPYFIYEIDPVDGKLIHTDREAILYLCYTLANLGDYQEVHAILENCNMHAPLNKYECDLLEQMTLIDHWSGAALAIQLRVGLKVMQFDSDLRSKLGEAGARKFKDDEKKFYENLKEKFKQYLLLKGTMPYGHIPRLLELDVQEELKLSQKFSNLNYTAYLEQKEMGATQVSHFYKSLPLSIEWFNNRSLDISSDTLEDILQNYSKRAFTRFIGTGYKPTGSAWDIGSLQEVFFLALQYAISLPKDQPTAFDVNLHVFEKRLLDYLQQLEKRENYDCISFKKDAVLPAMNLLVVLQYVRIFPEKFQTWKNIDLEDEQALDDLQSIIAQVKKDIADGVLKNLTASQNAEAVRLPTSIKIPTLHPIQAEEIRRAQRLRPKELLEADPVNTFPWQVPLSAIYQIHFAEPENKPVYGDQHKIFALSSYKESPLLKKEENTLAKKRLEAIEKAYNEINLKKSYSVHKPKANDKPKNIVKSLNKFLNGTIEEVDGQNVVDAGALKRLETLKESIKSLANYPNDKELSLLSPELQAAALHHRLNIRGKRAEPIDLHEHVLFAIMAKNPALMKSLNPFLSDSQIDRIFNDGISYMLLAVQVSQAQEALSSLRKIKGADPKDAENLLQQAATVLMKSRSYDPVKYPELLLYEFATALMLRTQPDQAKLLIEIFRLLENPEELKKNPQALRHMFIEFQAGGGKTKVLAMLIAARAILEGKLPVFFALPELEDVSNKDLSQTLQQVIAKHTISQKIPLQSNLTYKELNQFLQSLHEGLKKGCCQILIPETYHSLRLQWYKSIFNQIEPKERVLAQIMAFYENHAIFIVDEGHLNAGSLLQAIVAFGKPEKLPAYQKNFLMHIFETLCGLNKVELSLNDARLVKDVLGLLKNQQALTAPKDKEECLKSLAKYICAMPSLGVAKEKQAELCVYLLDRKLDPPEWLMSWCNHDDEKQKQQSNLIFLARGLCTELFPTTFGMVGRMSYGPSPKQGDPVDSPWRQMEASKGKFEDPDVAAVITLQGILQRGLTETEHLKTLISLLKAIRNAEIKKGQKLGQTDIETSFLAWQKASSAPLPLHKIDDGFFQRSEDVKNLLKLIGNHPEALKHYLLEYALSAVKLFPQKLSSTANNLIEGSSATICMSATLGPEESYPYLGQDPSRYLEDLAFLADVIQRSCLTHNRKMIWMQSTTPEAYFEGLFSSNKETFAVLEGVVNVGGYCKEYKNEQWADAFSAFQKKHLKDNAYPYDGVLFSIALPPTPQEPLGKKVLKIRLKDGSEIEIPGSDVKGELKKRSLENMRLFKIMGPNDSVGSDWPFTSKAQVAILLGEELTLSALVQAILRLRLFLAPNLDPDLSQSLLWCGDPKLAEIIKAIVGGAEVPDVFFWALLGDAELQKNSIIARAYQDIDFVFKHMVETESKNFSSRARIVLFNDYAKLFQGSLQRNLLEKYGRSNSLENADKMLWEYANQLDHGAGGLLESYPAAKERIASVITQTQAVLGKIPSPKGKDLRGIAVQEQQSESIAESIAETQQKSRLQNQAAAFGSTPFQPLDYAEQSCSLTSPELFAAESQYFLPANTLLKTKILHADLIMLKNTFNIIAPPAGAEVNPIKPIPFFLVVEEEKDGKICRRAFAASEKDAAIYQLQLASGEVSLENKRRALLFTDDGILAQQQKGAFRTEELEELKTTDWFKEIVTDISLISARTHAEKAIAVKAASHMQEIKALWKTLSVAHIDVNDSMELLMESLEPLQDALFTN